MNSYICIHIWIHINYGFIWTFYVFGCTKVPHVGCLLGAWAGPARGLVVQSTTWDAGDPGSNPALGTASSGHATVTTRSMSLTCHTDVPESPPTTWTLNLPDTSLRCSAKKLSTGANGQTENAASPLSALRRFWSSCHWQPARPPALSERPQSVSSQFKFVQVAYHIKHPWHLEPWYTRIHIWIHETYEVKYEKIICIHSLYEFIHEFICIWIHVYECIYIWIHVIIIWIHV